MKPRDFEIINGRYFVSTNVASFICGVTSASYNNWERSANPPPRDASSGLVPLDELGNWIRAEQILKPGRGGGGFPYCPSIDRLYQARGVPEDEAPETRLKRLQADKIQLEIDKSRGLLVEADEVRQGWETILSRVRARLLRIPAALAPLVTGVSDTYDVQQKLEDGVREALEQLATGTHDEQVDSDEAG